MPRIILFMSEQRSTLLEDSEHFFFDCTFSVSPNLFYQVASLHVIVAADHAIPVMYRLLPNKQEVTYQRLFGNLRSKCLGWQPKTLVMDMELAMFNAATDNFPGLTISLCSHPLDKHPHTFPQNLVCWGMHEVVVCNLQDPRQVSNGDVRATADLISRSIPLDPCSIRTTLE